MRRGSHRHPRSGRHPELLSDLPSPLAFPGLLPRQLFDDSGKHYLRRLAVEDGPLGFFEQHPTDLRGYVQWKILKHLLVVEILERILSTLGAALRALAPLVRKNFLIGGTAGPLGR